MDAAFAAVLALLAGAPAEAAQHPTADAPAPTADTPAPTPEPPPPPSPAPADLARFEREIAELHATNEELVERVDIVEEDHAATSQRVDDPLPAELTTAPPLPLPPPLPPPLP